MLYISTQICNLTVKFLATFSIRYTSCANGQIINVRANIYAEMCLNSNLFKHVPCLSLVHVCSKQQDDSVALSFDQIWPIYPAPVPVPVPVPVPKWA